MILEIRPTQGECPTLTLVLLLYHESKNTGLAIQSPKRAGRCSRQVQRHRPSFTPRGHTHAKAANQRVPETLTWAARSSFPLGATAPADLQSLTRECGNSEDWLRMRLIWVVGVDGGVGAGQIVIGDGLLRAVI